MTQSRDDENRLKNITNVAIVFIIGIVIGAALYAYAPELYRTSDNEPPANFAIVSDRLHTAGQPTKAQLKALKKAGYDIVVNLSPPQVFGSIQEEGGIVAQTGLKYVNIPIDWHKPSDEDFIFFSDILNQSKFKQILVHCQVNKRASLFAFLYRVVHEGIEPDKAYEGVIKIWAPDPHWITYTKNILAKHRIDYEPL